MAVPSPWTLRDGRSVTVRRAVPDDAQRILEHVNRVAAEGVYIMTERLRHSLEEEREILRGFDGQAGLFLVALVADELVATADFRRGAQAKNAHTASLGIAIRKELRGLGLGRAMLEEGIRWARSVGIRKLTLGVFATNEPAIRLYRSLGFVEEGRLRGQVILGGIPVDELLLALWT